MSQQVQALQQENQEVIVRLYRTEKQLDQTNQQIQQVLGGIASAAGFSDKEIQDGLSADKIIERVKELAAEPEELEKEDA